MAAVNFELKQQLAANEDLLLQPKSGEEKKGQTEWAWKKKTQEELARQISGPTVQAGQAADDDDEDEEDEDSFKTAASDGEESDDDDEFDGFREDLQEITARVSKRNAEEEQKKKAEEYSKFMEDIQDILSKPLSPEEDPGLWDAMMEEDRKTKKSRKKTKEAKEKPAIVLTNVDKIKSRLQKEKTDQENRQQSKLEKSKSEGGSSRYVKGLQDQLWGGPSKDEGKAEKNRATQGRFVEQIGRTLMKKQEQPDDSILKPTRARVARKIIPMPETEQQAAATETKAKKSSYEWKYKKKDIQELQNFLEENKAMLPQGVKDRSKDVGDNMATREEEKKLDDDDENEEEEEDGKKENPSAAKDKMVEDYDTFMSEIEEFLSAPDHSAREVNFKTEIEKYMDLIEEPKKKAKKSKKAKSSEAAKIPKPKKLNLDWIEDLNRPEDDIRLQQQHQSDKRGVDDLRERLVQELNKDAKKGDVHVPKVGTSSIKSTYEKMSKESEVPLLGPRTCRLQKGVEEMVVAEEGVKSLEEIKAEQEQRKWRWKEKKVQDLQEIVKARDQVKFAFKISSVFCRFSSCSPCCCCCCCCCYCCCFCFFFLLLFELLPLAVSLKLCYIFC